MASQITSTQIKRNLYRKCNLIHINDSKPDSSTKENVVVVRGVSYRCHENGSLTKISTLAKPSKPWNNTKAPFLYNSNALAGPSHYKKTSGRVDALQTSKRFIKHIRSIPFNSLKAPQKLNISRFRIITKNNHKPHSSYLSKVNYAFLSNQFQKYRLSKSVVNTLPSSRYKWVRRDRLFKKVSVSCEDKLNAPQSKENVARHLSNKVLKSSLNRLRKKTKQKLSTNNQKYCMYFCRFGRCNNESVCPYKHDPDKIVICTRFLRGTCKIDNCPFSHNLSADKMPACSFYLQGNCTNDPCPYRHVKVAATAAVCSDFNRGYCPKGEQCKLLHQYSCVKCRHYRKRIKKCAECQAKDNKSNCKIIQSKVRRTKASVFSNQQTTVEAPKQSEQVEIDSDKTILDLGLDLAEQKNDHQVVRSKSQSCPFFIPLFSSQAIESEPVHEAKSIRSNSPTQLRSHSANAHRWIGADYDSDDTWYEEPSDDSDYDAEREKQKLMKLVPQFLFESDHHLSKH